MDNLKSPTKSMQSSSTEKQILNQSGERKRKMECSDSPTNDEQSPTKQMHKSKPSTVIIPMTISQIKNHNFNDFKNGIQMVKIVGLVTAIHSNNQCVNYEIDDGSDSPITAEYWRHDEMESDSNIISNQLKSYIVVIGSIRCNENKKKILAIKINLLEDLNELTYHYIQVMKAKKDFLKMNQVHHEIVTSSLETITNFESISAIKTRNEAQENHRRSINTMEGISTLLFYNINYPIRGKIIIFNQCLFEEFLNVDDRMGTENDVKNLERTFKRLGFQDDQIDINNNLTCDEIQDCLETVATKTDHSHIDILICVVSSHGQQNNFYTTNGLLPFTNLWYYFSESKCPSLKGKPKLFIIQACRGERVDKGTSVKCIQTEKSLSDSEYEDSVSSEIESIDSFPYTTMPANYDGYVTEPDFLVAHSSVDGIKIISEKLDLLLCAVRGV